MLKCGENSGSYLYNALDLDLRRGGAGTVPPEPGPALGPGGEPPRREERGTERGGEDAGGAPAERGTDGGARVSTAGTDASRGGLTPRRSPCADGRAVLPSGGAGACQRDGRAGRPRGRRAPVGPGDRAGEPGPEGPGERLRIRAQTETVAQFQPDPGARPGTAGQATPVTGAGPGAGRPAAGREPDAVECAGEGLSILLDNSHSIPSLKPYFNSLLTPKTAGEVYHNGRLLLTPQGEIIEQVVASRPIFRDSDFQEIVTRANKVKKGRSPEGGASDTRGAARAKRSVFAVAACNPDLCVFVTFTQSPELVHDRYDYKEAVHRLGVWLDNRVRRRGLKYIMVPEYHQDGAIHWHGLVNEVGVRLVDSGHRDKEGAIIYNVSDWHLGFTTASKVKDHGACCRYVSKYISKQLGAGTIGGRYWLHGGDLAKPIVHLFDCSIPEGGKRVEIEEAGLVLWYGGKLSK